MAVCRCLHMDFARASHPARQRKHEQSKVVPAIARDAATGPPAPLDCNSSGCRRFADAWRCAVSPRSMRRLSRPTRRKQALPGHFDWPRSHRRFPETPPSNFRRRKPRRDLDLTYPAFRSPSIGDLVSGAKRIFVHRSLIPVSCAPPVLLRTADSAKRFPPRIACGAGSIGMRSNSPPRHWGRTIAGRRSGATGWPPVRHRKAANR